MIDLATRSYNKTWSFDPIIRSLLDTDTYKLLMLQLIHSNRKIANAIVQFSLIVRTKDNHLGSLIKREHLEAQLDNVMSLKFSPNELIWLAGNTFYGTEGIFKPEFIKFLSTIKLPPYKIESWNDNDIKITFTGSYEMCMLWEIYALSIVSELRTISNFNGMSKLDIDILFSVAKTKIWSKLTDISAQCNNIKISDFGTRRRFSFLWQEWVINASKAILNEKFAGTSNLYLAMKYGLEAIGTNGHELPMVYAGLAENDEELKDSQYQVLRDWQTFYGGRLLVMLPDTFGTTQFLRNGTEFLHWKGIRGDSKDSIEGCAEAMAWWGSNGIDPKTRLYIFSDGLDSKPIINLNHRFVNRVQDGYGWGTLLTNDFNDCCPNQPDKFKPLSIVCKVTRVNDRSAVKLSDNPGKYIGDDSEITRYLRVFQDYGAAERTIFV